MSDLKVFSSSSTAWESRAESSVRLPTQRFTLIMRFFLGFEGLPVTSNTAPEASGLPPPNPAPWLAGWLAHEQGELSSAARLNCQPPVLGGGRQR